MTKQNLNLALATITFIKAKGINTAFGVIGGAIEPITNAINNSSFNEIYPAHENTCAYAAAQYFDYSKKPALVFSTTGSGILNLLNGVGSAYAEHKPMFIIVPQEPLNSHDKKPLQSSRYGGVNTINMLREVTCYTDEIISSSHLEEKLNLAWYKMIEHQQPIAISIPNDIQKLPIKNTVKNFGELYDFNNKIELFRSIDKNDCIILGEHSSEFAKDIINFSVLKNCPIIDTPTSRGIIHKQTPNYDGMIGLFGNDSAIEVINKAKRIFYFLGEITQSNIGDRSSWLDKTIMVHTKPQFLYRNRGLKIVADKSSLNAFFYGQNSHNLDYLKISEVIPSPESLGSINTENLFDYLSAKLPLDTHVFFDSGNSFMFGLNRWQVNKSFDNYDKTINVVINQASMAAAIPMLIGAATARPELNYLCITGDGSFKMGSNELSLIKQLNLKVIIVVLNDSVMGMAMHGQRITGAKKVGFENGFTDFSQIAKASGLKSKVIETIADIKNVNLTITEPLLLDVRVDKEVVPPILGRLGVLGTLE